VTGAALPAPGPPQTLAEWVDTRLRSAILTGELAAGEKLRSEHLAAEWGVSPTPVREAFQRLAGEGLVVIEPQRGARVAEIDAAEAADYYELRLTLDPKALRSSMRAANDAYRHDVEQAYRQLVSTRGGVPALLDVHRTFHLALLSRCSNRHLLRLCTQLHDHTQRYQVTGTGPRRRGDPAGEHLALRDAVLHGNVNAATNVLTGHLKATLTAIRAGNAPPPR
jgi:GntR family transcriptional regulator, carbon starvation induced regulator